MAKAVSLKLKMRVSQDVSGSIVQGIDSVKVA